MKSFTDEYPQFHTRSTRAGPKMLIRYCRSNVTQAHRLIRSLKFGEMSFATKLDPLTSISLANQKLSISFPGGEKRDFNLTWLRDHCPCPLCIHPTNRQKLHASGFVSLHQDPKSVTISEGRLIVDWSTGSIESIQDAPKGHTSTYSLDFLKNFNPNQSHTLKLILWERDAFDRAQQTVAYKDMMGSDDAFKIVLKQLKDYGLIIIKDVPREINHVETLAEKFGPIRHTFYGKSWNVKNFPFAKNIAYTSLKLDLHMDLMCVL